MNSSTSSFQHVGNGSENKNFQIKISQDGEFAMTFDMGKCSLLRVNFMLVHRCVIRLRHDCEILRLIPYAVMT
jgi:hypothetical protein